MFRWKPAALLSLLMVLALALTGCFGGLSGVAPRSLDGAAGLSGGGPRGTDPYSAAAFPADGVRDADLAAHVPGEMLVGVESEEVARRVAARLDAELKNYVPEIGLARLELRDKTRSLTDAMRSLRGEPGVRYAQANFKMYSLPVQDVRVLEAADLGLGPDQFDSIYEPGSDYNKWQYGLRSIRAEAAWERGLTGEGTILAVIDTGVQADHPFLGGKVLPGYNPGHESDETDDWNGHGTHVAGIAAGAYHAGRGFIGIAPDALILPIRVFNEDTASNFDVAVGLLVAADPTIAGLPLPPADVANMSLGGAVYSLALQDAINFALDRNVVVVAAMGNTSNEAIRYPAAYQGVIAVGATDAHDDKTDFSTTGEHISVAAPGYDIFSAYSQNRIAWSSGTSMATPHVAGAALILRQLYPDATPAQIKDLLERTADFKEGYRFQQLGHGRINLERALSEGLDGRPRGDIEVFVYYTVDDEPIPIAGADVTLWRGQQAVAYNRTGGGFGVYFVPYDGIARFFGLEPGDNYWIEVRLEEALHGTSQGYRVDNVAVRAGEMTSLRVKID